MGPLLFFKFINDLPLYTDSASTNFYADDTTFYVIGNSLETIQRNLQVALDCLAKWCKCNGMLIKPQNKSNADNNTTKKNKFDELNMIINDKILDIIIDNI